MSDINAMEHTGLVNMVLNTHTWLFSGNSCWTSDDAFQEGMIALLDALETYDSDLGTVATYCIQRIKWHLFREFRKQQSLIRKPINLYSELQKYKKIELEYLQKHQMEPDIKYMASRMKMTVFELKRFLELFHQELSLDSPISEEGESTIGDMVEDDRDHFEEIDYKLQMIKLRNDLQRMMDEKLTAPEQKLLKEYYAWDGGDIPTLTAVAERNNLTYDVVNTKIKRALAKFQRYRPELVRHYPDLIMYQIYTQPFNALSDLKSLKIDTIRKFLTVGDLVQVNSQYGTVSNIDYAHKAFIFTCNGNRKTYLFKSVMDFEMHNRKITTMIIN